MYLLVSDAYPIKCRHPLMQQNGRSSTVPLWQIKALVRCHVLHSEFCADTAAVNREALSDEEMHRIAQAIITILADELTRHGLYNPSPALSCVQEETLSDIEDLSANDTGSGK